MLKKKFSVLMSVYYKENPIYLMQALSSVFEQTIMPDEVILVEDGNLTEKLDKIVEIFNMKYKQLKVFKLEQNVGLGKALNFGLLKCSNEIVFRMDSDDICVNNRFEKTLKIFEEKNVDVVGGNITEYDENMKNISGYRNVPSIDSDISKMMKKRNAVNHVTVAYKKSKVIEAGNYLDMPYFEDYYLWVRMKKNNCIFYNIPETLVNVRCGNDMIKRRGGKKYVNCILSFEKKLLEIKFINCWRFIINVLERIGVSIVPNKIRNCIYKNVLRKKDENNDKNKNLETINSHELKKIQIEILDYVSNFCKKNNIKYWLDSGTLLGAIRHSGYIPWDDDIDIGMLREDYEKFIKTFNIENKSKYKLHCFENDKEWVNIFGKVIDESTILYEPDEISGHKIGVNIDIFVYDNIKNSKMNINAIYNLRDLYRKLNSLQAYKHFSSPTMQKYNFIRYPLHYFLKLFPKRFFLKKAIKNCKRYNNVETGYLGNLTAKTRMICEKEVFNSFIDVKFEGKMYSAPIGYDLWLKSFYGDYMKLPPKEKQVSNHKFVAYYKEK